MERIGVRGRGAPARARSRDREIVFGGLLGRIKERKKRKVRAAAAGAVQRAE